jgi:hypothetical protein
LSTLPLADSTLPFPIQPQHGNELLVSGTREGFHKNISDIFLPRNRGHRNLTVLDMFADEMPACVDVLGKTMAFHRLREADGTEVVAVETEWKLLRKEYTR